MYFYSIIGERNQDEILLKSKIASECLLLFSVVNFY